MKYVIGAATSCELCGRNDNIRGRKTGIAGENAEVVSLDVSKYFVSGRHKGQGVCVEYILAFDLNFIYRCK